MAVAYLTGEFPGVGGVIKQRVEDFFVQEVPRYEPSGEGEHVYCEIQKVGITTFEAIDRIARALDVPVRDIGYAGMKDARAVTRQVLSIRGTSEAAVMGLAWPDLTVQWAARHGNKLRLGHLAGNRFAVKIRQVRPTDVVKLKPMVRMLETRGMPNYFGQQRFGRRGDNDQLGAALVRGDNQGVLSLLLGRPDEALDPPLQRKARQLFDEGDYEGAMKQWPRRSGMERRILARFIKTSKAGAAVRAVEERIRRLWVSALQSRLFNEVVARRIESLDRVMEGDLAWKHENGACFRVQSVETEQARCAAFEISPTGPLLGYRMTLAEGEPGRIEQAVFAETGLTAGEFRLPGKDKVKGARRPLRVKPVDVELAAGVDEHGEHITVAFTLPAGSFATVLLGELMKTADEEADPMEEQDTGEPPVPPQQEGEAIV
jgi:tRNA pseudouridine13 synthase